MIFSGGPLDGMDASEVTTAYGKSVESNGEPYLYIPLETKPIFRLMGLREVEVCHEYRRSADRFEYLGVARRRG